jgi:hypothetical protein
MEPEHTNTYYFSVQFNLQTKKVSTPFVFESYYPGYPEMSLALTMR